MTQPARIGILRGLRCPSVRRPALVVASVLALGSDPALVPGDVWAEERTESPTEKRDSAGTQVAPGKFEALRAGGGLTPVSPASTELGWELAEGLESAWRVRLEEQLVGSPKLLRRLTESPRPDGEVLVRVPEGGYRTVVRGADGGKQEVVLLGDGFAVRDAAEALGAVDRPETWQRTYAALHDRIRGVLSGDGKRLDAILRGLPAPYAPDGKRPDYAKLSGKLAAQWIAGRPGDLADRAEEKADCSKCAAAVGAVSAPGKEEAACGKPRKDGLLHSADWPLRTGSTCARDQGKTRGTQIAFAISAGVEALVAESGGACVDLSEQHLHYAQKNEWFPIPPNFGDDENAVGEVLGAMLGAYTFRYERAWPYNPSPKRIVTEGSKLPGSETAPYGYAKSCDGYDAKPCSDTNHQGEYVCEKDRSGKTCGYTASVADAASVIRVVGYAPLLDVREPLRGVELARAFVELGVPVVASFAVTESFLAGAAGGYVGAGGKEDALLGWHTALVEGFVANDRLPREARKGDGGGYFVMKNSWGACVGDAGYWYVPAAWLERHARSLTALTAILAKGNDIRREVGPTATDEDEDGAADEPVLYKSTCLSAPTIWDPWPTPDENTAVLYPSDGFDDRIDWEWHNYSCPESYSHLCINLVTNGTAPQGNVCFWQAQGPTFPVNPDNSRWTGLVKLETGPYADPSGPPYTALRGREIEIRVKSCVPSQSGGEADCLWSEPRRALVALSSPRLLFPGAVGEVGNRVTAIGTRQPVFYWTADPDADFYRLVIQKTGPITPAQQEVYETTEPGFVMPSPIGAGLGNEVVWWVRSCKTIGGQTVCSRTNWEELHEQYWYLALPEAGVGPDPQQAASMFNLVAQVFRHPRCTNCHAAGDQPLRYDPPNTAPHGGNCVSCHFEGNGVGAPYVPADALHPWQKAPASMALTADMSAHDICEQIKEHKTPEENVEHVAIDELIIYAWDPGGNREPAPGTHASFVSILNQWAQNGGACPP